MWRDVRQKTVSTAAGEVMAPRDAHTQSPRTCEQVTSLVKGVLQEGQATDLEMGIILDYPRGPSDTRALMWIWGRVTEIRKCCAAGCAGRRGHKPRDVSSS